MNWAQIVAVVIGWILTIVGGHEIAANSRSNGIWCVLQGALCIASGFIR